MESDVLIKGIYRYLDINYPLKRIKDGKFFRSGIVIQSWESHDSERHRLLINTTNKRILVAELINNTISDVFSLSEKETRKILIPYFMKL
jgi:hypothetical protein